jgi:hypothetical protein
MTLRVTFAGGKNSNNYFKWQRGNLLYKLINSTNIVFFLKLQLSNVEIK